jgi:PAS domain S-box-containing protein
MNEFRRILRQALFFPIVLLLLLAGFFLQQIGQAWMTLHSMNQSERITSELSGLRSLLEDQDVGMCGFELTKDKAMLGSYNSDLAAIQTHFTNLRGLLARNPGQLKQLADLTDRYELWLGHSQKILNNDADTMNDPQVYQRDQQMVEQIRSHDDEMLHSEDVWRAQLPEQEPNLKHQEMVSIVSASLCIGLALALFTRQRLRKVSQSYKSALDALEDRSREVLESRQWFQTTLESIGDAVIACDIDGRITFMNAIAVQLTGWTAEEALQCPLVEVFQIIHEETRASAENPVEQVLRQKKVAGLASHTLLVSRKGREFVIDDIAAPIVDAQGEMRGVVLVFRDVTEQRKAESALVAGEKLAVAGRLAASIAHEIHNPLDSVANLLFLLRDETDPEKRVEYLQMAQQELGRTMQISRTMLSLYREPKAPIQVDLKDLIDGVLLLLERRIAQQQIEVKKEYLAPCVVEGFPTELRQVITNVVVNAIEAAGPNGRMRIRIKPAAAEELQSAGALIEVADSGGGVTETASEHVFQPFFTTKGEHGTGLGLWVSMGIVQKHGGTIRLQNCNEKLYPGACARIYLPTKTLAGTGMVSQAQRAS